MKRQWLYSVLVAAFVASFGTWISLSWAADAGSKADYRETMQKQVKITFDGRETAIYHYGEALDKPYFHPLWTPDRRIVTYDSPADHVHHRGLCVGWPDVSGNDFWAEIWSPAGKQGKIVSQEAEVHPQADGSITLVDKNEWRGEYGTVWVAGEFSWTLLPPRENLQRVDVRILLTARQPEVIFGSDSPPREYHGLTVRIGPFTEPRYFNALGDEGGQNCKGKAARWCAVSGRQSGKPVLVALMDSPENVETPAQFYVQDQGMQFVSTSPNMGRAKVLNQGETWELTYRVIAAGEPPTGHSWDLQALWREFAEGK